MGVTGFQDYWIAGARVYFKRDDVGGVDQPMLDFGTIKSATPAIEVTEVELRDADCGLSKVVAKQVTQLTESYATVCSNFNTEMLALLMMSDPAEDFTQSATPVVGASQDPAHKGYLMKLRDAAGDSIYALTSIEAVKDSLDVTTYVLDTDYEIVDLDRGIIRIMATGTIVENDEILVSFTPVAVTGKRLVKPQTQNNIEGEVWVYYSRDGCDEQNVRHARASITPASSTVTAEDFSENAFTITILTDVTAAEPAGEMLYFKGAEPDLS